MISHTGENPAIVSYATMAPLMAYGTIIGLHLFTNNLFIIAKCTVCYTWSCSTWSSVLLVCTLRLFPLSFYPCSMHLSSQRHPFIIVEPFAKLLSMFFSHCWVTSSDSLMHELKTVNINSSTWHATGCAMLPSTVVCLLLREPESYNLLRLLITTAVCCCVDFIGCD